MKSVYKLNILSSYNLLKRKNFIGIGFEKKDLTSLNN